VGGEWVLKGDTTEGCTANAKIPTMSLECDGMPRELRSTIEGTSSAQRISTLASSFGDLGGKWTVLVPKNKCEATFEGASFTATCEGSPNVLTVTFDGSTASGSLADSFELSAKRR
jgi:hypothetical protein